MSTVLVVALAAAVGGQAPLRPVRLEQVEIHDDFWKPRIEVLQETSLPALLAEFDERGYVRNFALAAGLEEGAHHGLPTDDADLYKWIEAAGYTLMHAEDEELEARADALIELIVAAQEPDGYLHTYHTVLADQERWMDIRHGHELFSTGHLIEAGIAYWRATGKRALLDTASLAADHVGTRFGPGRERTPPGHAGIELALFALADATGEERYAELGEFLLLQRGSNKRRKKFGSFAQDRTPVFEQGRLEGHAVRATYLYAGLAQMALTTGDPRPLGPLVAIWRDVRARKQYLTGGIGHTAPDAGFALDHELPNETALCETCAGVGMVRWGQRLFLLTRHATFADGTERVLYNNVLAGMSPSGERFSYRNPLASAGDVRREALPEPSCCPTNLARCLASIGELIYAHDDENVYVALYVGSAAEIELARGTIRIVQETRYPADGKVALRIETEEPVRFGLHLRIPGWCEETFDVGVGDAVREAQITHGDDPGTWVTFDRRWSDGDVLHLALPLPVKRVYADERVEANRDRVALQRGPLVYAFEAVDNGGSLRDVIFPDIGELREAWEPELLGGVHTAHARGVRVGQDEQAEVDLVAIPYNLWGCRDPGEMLVWIPEKEIARSTEAR